MATTIDAETCQAGWHYPHREPPAFPSGVFSGASITSRVSAGLRAHESSDSMVCLPGTYREETTVRLPQGLRIKSLPKNVELSNEVGSYSARYLAAEGSVTVRRTLTFTPHGLCGPDIVRAFAEIARTASVDFSSHLRYE